MDTPVRRLERLEQQHPPEGLIRFVIVEGPGGMVRDVLDIDAHEWLSVERFRERYPMVTL